MFTAQELVHITVRENERLTLPGDKASATRVRDTLLAATTPLRESPLRLDRHGHLHSRGFVGLLQAGNVSLRILPKVRAGSDVDSDEQFLTRLLVRSGLVPYRLAHHAGVERTSMPLLELVIRHCAQHMQQMLSTHGVPRRYAEIRELRDTVIGAIDLDAAMRQMPHERNLVPIVHAPLHDDNDVTRMLRSLASHLKRATTSTRTLRLLDDVEEQLAGAFPVELTPTVVSACVLQPEEEHWTSELELARGLCDGLLPNPLAPGRVDSRALLFSLDDVFERLVRSALAADPETWDWRLDPRTPSRYFLRDRHTGKRRLRLRPDIVMRSRRTPDDLRVADAKWKTLSIDSGGNLKLDRSDVYQISAYMNRYRVDAGLLLMPADASTKGEHDTPWTRTLDVVDSSSRVTVAAVDVYGLVSDRVDVRARAQRQLRRAVELV